MSELNEEPAAGQQTSARASVRTHLEADDCLHEARAVVGAGEAAVLQHLLCDLTYNGGGGSQKA